MNRWKSPYKEAGIKAENILGTALISKKKQKQESKFGGILSITFAQRGIRTGHIDDDPSFAENKKII